MMREKLLVSAVLPRPRIRDDACARQYKCLAPYKQLLE